jgi:glycolate oxidase FAD binding subunit
MSGEARVDAADTIARYLPESREELARAVAELGGVRIVGADTHAAWRPPAPQGVPILDLTRLAGVVEFHPDDQVVVVRAGTRIADLQAAVEARGQCLPVLERQEGTVGGALMMNLPHSLERICGGWRDWVLGMTVVRADGTIARCGSQAVKNVAGYDIHRFLVGTRGTLAVVAEAILRTYPLASLPVPGEPCDVAPAPWRVEDETLRHYMRRAKAILDPEEKLNPGEMPL